MTEFDLGLVLAAWITGLAGGGGHCLGMCGGIVGAIGIGQGKGPQATLRVLAAHVGRIASYAGAGAISGLAGAQLITGLFGPSGMALLRIIAALLILAIGLQLVLGRSLLRGLEKGGVLFWRRLAPHMQRFLPPRDIFSAVALGAMWGWLPCGLVYAELAVAAAAGGPVEGALVMTAFGVGTLVSLSIVGVLLQSLGMSRLPRQASGVLLVLFAVWTAWPVVMS